MKTLAITIVLFLSVAISPSAYDQKCKSFFNSKVFKMSNQGTFLAYGQSTYQSVEVRKKKQFEIIFIGKTEYKMGIATEFDYEPVHFRMIETKTKKVLYDNKKTQYQAYVDFYMEKTQSVTLEITVLAVDEPFILPEDLRVCLGIKIYNQAID